jgi:hypothetical protein
MIQQGFCDLLCSKNIRSVFKWKLMVCVCVCVYVCVSHEGECWERCTEASPESLEGIPFLQHIGIDGVIILKWILNWGGSVDWIHVFGAGAGYLVFISFTVQFHSKLYPRNSVTELSINCNLIIPYCYDLYHCIASPLSLYILFVYPAPPWWWLI